MEQGWDDGVKTFFKKILFSISYGLIWMISFVAFGLFGGYASTATASGLAVIIFYIVMGVTFVLFIRYLFKIWRQ